MAPRGPGCLGWELRSEPGDIRWLCRAGAALSWVRALQPGPCAPWVRALAMRLVTWSPDSSPWKPQDDPSCPHSQAGRTRQGH